MKDDDGNLELRQHLAFARYGDGGNDDSGGGSGSGNEGGGGIMAIIMDNGACGSGGIVAIVLVPVVMMMVVVVVLVLVTAFQQLRTLADDGPIRQASFDFCSHLFHLGHFFQICLRFLLGKSQLQLHVFVLGLRCGHRNIILGDVRMLWILPQTLAFLFFCKPRGTKNASTLDQLDLKRKQSKEKKLNSPK
jgi:hypothetical protein